MKNMLKKYIRYCIVFSVLVFSACEASEGERPPVSPPAVSSVAVSIDKASYLPGEEVVITISQSVPSTVKVRYRFLNEILEEASVEGTTWKWIPPLDDFKGYLIEIVDQSSSKELILGTVAVDVSSDWSKFPRYGFLSKYPAMSGEEIKKVIDNLNRHHINGIQFYDWHYKHHQPLAGTPQNPTLVYKDIFNRDIHFSTIEKYIQEAHEHGMKAMFYNLVYGAWSNASTDGVSDQWYIFKDKNHITKDKHPLPQPPFLSDIFVLDPSNNSWHDYIAAENEKVYTALPFDGFHMDQLGDRGQVYSYTGSPVNLASGFADFIEAMKVADSDKRIVMNAVNQFGQSQMATTNVDFLYTEVWSPNENYSDLARIIIDNNNYGDNQKQTVLAAYMNYNLADHAGFFNTSSVLLTDAVIFAFGGSHLELGEHMLAKEYFPNSNLAMKDDLKKALVNYYDFLVAYQNLLRGGGSFNNPVVSSTDGKVQLNQWPAQQGKVSVIGKEVSNHQVVQLVNFKNATTMQWRDNNGVQAVPALVENFKLSISVTKPVKKVWYSSPDIDKGASHQLEFTINNDQLTVKIPWLKYWDLIVIEYQ